MSSDSLAKIGDKDDGDEEEEEDEKSLEKSECDDAL